MDLEITRDFIKFLPNKTRIHLEQQYPYSWQRIRRNVDSHQPEHASACQLSRKPRTATRIALNRRALSIMTMKILLFWVISWTASLNSFNCNFVLSPFRKRRWLTVKQSRIWSNRMLQKPADFLLWLISKPLRSKIMSLFESHR